LPADTKETSWDVFRIKAEPGKRTIAEFEYLGTAFQTLSNRIVLRLVEDRKSLVSDANFLPVRTREYLPVLAFMDRNSKDLTKADFEEYLFKQDNVTKKSKTATNVAKKF